MPDTPLPAPILRQVLDGVERIFGSRGPEAVAEVCATVPRALPEGQVVRLVAGGPFGWLLDARLDREADGRYALEVLENSRMSGPDHHRVWEDGTREGLPTEQTAMAYPKDATDARRAEIEAAYLAHNREVTRQLEARGFR